MYYFEKFLTINYKIFERSMYNIYVVDNVYIAFFF